jgi:hypothetical protein
MAGSAETPPSHASLPRNRSNAFMALRSVIPLTFGEPSTGSMDFSVEAMIVAKPGDG